VLFLKLVLRLSGSLQVLILLPLSSNCHKGQL
jgi:hypothetical protein